MGETQLMLYVKPGVEPYQKRIEDIASMVRDILDIAQVDFIMVGSIFKKYNQFTEPSMSVQDNTRVSMSVKDLQYMDIFSQKLEHITRLNRAILEANKNDKNHGSHTADHATFIFKLNHFQAAIASDEFLMNVEALIQNLRDLHDHIISVTQLDFHESAYFRRLHEIQEKLEHVKHTLFEIQTERYHEAPISVSHIESEMKKIFNVYTMTNERFILLWLLKNPEATVDELLKQCKEDGYEQVDEEIELF